MKTSQILKEPITRHSEKPLSMYKYFERTFKISEMKCLDIFARKTNKYFDSYGNELLNHFVPKVNNLISNDKRTLVS